jgi:glyoxylase I family protein
MPITSRKIAPLFQVYDVGRSVAWYRDKLGFDVVQTHKPDGHFYWAMLKLGDTTLMLNAKYEDEDRPLVEPKIREGHDDVTLYFDCPDVDQAYAHVTASGIKAPPPEVTYYKMKQLTITDPDGFQLCFQQPAK